MYQHKVQYYETDKMGIVHHSNYIRWMEEARIDFLEEIGFGFDKLEAAGLVSPILSVECKYIKSTRFPEVIDIEVSILEFTGVKFKLAYVMKNAAGEKVCDGRPARLNKEYPDFYEAIIANMKA